MEDFYVTAVNEAGDSDLPNSLPRKVCGATRGNCGGWGRQRPRLPDFADFIPNDAQTPGLPADSNQYRGEAED